MDVNDLKPFDPDDIDETLTRVVVHGAKTHLLFPYVHAAGAEPKYQSIGIVIAGSVATVSDFHELTGRVKKAGEGAAWRIVFNTPWLVLPSADTRGADRTRRS
ncbi:MAG TPA: hypothetical protein VGI90_16880 [Steroidobacteraceae bacterium]|jgi:hypothetical protein